MELKKFSFTKNPNIVNDIDRFVRFENLQYDPQSEKVMEELRDLRKIDFDPSVPFPKIEISRDLKGCFLLVDEDEHIYLVDARKLNYPKYVLELINFEEVLLN